MARFYSSWNGVLNPGMNLDSILTVLFGLLTSLGSGGVIVSQRTGFWSEWSVQDRAKADAALCEAGASNLITLLEP